MLQFFKGVLVAELFALWVEFFYSFGIKEQPNHFFIAIPVYFVYLCALHRVFLIFRGRRLLWLIGIASGGIAGLLMEWFLVGNSPWKHPEVFQSGQFLVHGAYPILGYLLVSTPDTSPLRNRLICYMMAASGITSVGFAFGNSNLQKLWFIFLPLVVFVGLYYFIFRLGTSPLLARIVPGRSPLQVHTE